MSIKYVCYGLVRGSCGIKHKSKIAAEKCCMKDSKACKSQGGYSDRFVYKSAK